MATLPAWPFAGDHGTNRATIRAGRQDAVTGYASIDEADRAAFWEDGYLVKRALFTPEEVALANRVIETDPAIRGSRLRLADAQGGSTELALWNHPGEDVFGMIARCERVAGGAERLLGGEVYHYHSKLTMKRPGGGGRWEWHQDYGYWYQNGILFPDLLSVAVALEPATRENGCMQLLRGSHKMGRIEHGRVAGQTGADPERVEQAMAAGMELVHCEMGPGDALFFHSNTLHCSAANLSPRSRNLLICCYNRATNNPYKAHHHPSYTPLAKVPDEAVLAAGDRLAGAEERWFLEEGKDETTEARKAG
jgi:ectoine hydroxylase